MKCNGGEENIVRASISGNLIFFSIFRDNSDPTLKRDLTNDFVHDFSTWVYEGLELTSLNE